jgi:hypothetical protein
MFKPLFLLVHQQAQHSFSFRSSGWLMEWSKEFMRALHIGSSVKVHQHISPSSESQLASAHVLVSGRCRPSLLCLLVPICPYVQQPAPNAPSSSTTKAPASSSTTVRCELVWPLQAARTAGHQNMLTAFSISGLLQAPSYLLNLLLSSDSSAYSMIGN